MQRIKSSSAEKLASAEKFIAAKTADGNPVEDMTIKALREEVAKWKSDYEQKKSEVENLFGEKSDDAQTIIADVEQWRQEINQKGGDDVGGSDRKS